MARSKGRTGRPYRRLRARVIRQATVCCLCGGPLDKSLRWPDPMSATLEHLDPLSLGGSPVSAANADAAHLACNASRGNGTRSPAGGAREVTGRW